MKNKLLFLKLFCTLVFLFSFEIQAQNLDQSNTTGSQAGFLVNNAGANIAQSFVAGITGPLSAFHIRVGDINSTYFSAGDFQLILHSGDGITNPVILTQNFTILSVPSNAYVDYVINIPSGTAMVAGNTYTAELRGLTGSVLIVGNSPADYIPGGFYFNNGNTFFYNTYDMWFKTFISSGASLNFDGIDDIVTVNTTLGNFRTGDFTIEMNVKTVQGSTYLLSKRGICNNDNFLSIGLGYNGKVNIETSNVNVPGSGIGFFGNIQINDNTWHSISITRIAGRLTIYIDGVFDADFIPTTPENTNIDLNSSYVLQFGGNAPCTPFGPQVFSGNLDEIKFWERGLTQCEIQNNLGAELPLGQAGLISYYQFNQGVSEGDNTSQTTLLDKMGNNNGTLQNFLLTGGPTSNWVADGAVVSGSTNPLFVTPNSIITNSSDVLTVAESLVTSYQWATCDGNNVFTSIPGATSQNYTATALGDYTVFVTKNGCTYRSDCFNISTLGTISFDNADFNFYPNPTTGVLNMNYSKEVSEVSILNLLGQVVLVSKPNSLQVQLDLSMLPSATYFVKVLAEGVSKTTKIIKQ